MCTNKWAVVLLFVVGLCACSKKGDIIQPPPPTQPVTGKLAKLSFDSGAYDSLYYAPSGNLIKIKSVFDPSNGVSVIIYSFDYNAQGKLTRIHNDQGVEYRYTYSGDQLDEVGIYISGLKTGHKGFTYNADGVLTASATYSDLLSNPSDQDFIDMCLYTYYPDGNLKTETTYSVEPATGKPVKEVSITYSDYDNNHNPDDLFKQLPYFFGVKFSKNNARTRILKNEKTGVESTYLFTYTYNQLTLPITRKFEYYGSGNWQEGTCTYSYY